MVVAGVGDDLVRPAAALASKLAALDADDHQVHRQLDDLEQRHHRQAEPQARLTAEVRDEEQQLKARSTYVLSTPAKRIK